MTKRARRKKYEPIDYTRCQSMIRQPSYTSFGIGNEGTWRRCPNSPTVVASRFLDGQEGSMSLCDRCLQVALVHIGPEHVKVRHIL